MAKVGRRIEHIVGTRTKSANVNRNILLIGFGSVGQGLLPLLLRHFRWLTPERLHIVTADGRGEAIAREYGVTFDILPVTQANFACILDKMLGSYDILVNIAVEVSSLDLIRWCAQHDVLYLDTCVEPWAGGYVNAACPGGQMTNYRLREEALALARPNTPTAVIAHGANPGLVTHFVKRALSLLADRSGIHGAHPYSELAYELGVRAIHIAERDTQNDRTELGYSEFANTWSVDGLLSEALQPAELAWGTHEGVAPSWVNRHPTGSGVGVYLNTPGVATKIRSWVPSTGEYSAYLISHHESLSIAAFLTVLDSQARIVYRPTVLYAYRPSDKTCLSLEQWRRSGYREPKQKSLLRDEIVEGCDELGVLLLREHMCFWFGSCLSHQQAASLVPYNNATTLQVNAGILGALQWMIKNPWKGVVEAEHMDHEEVLDVALSYLGDVFAIESDWRVGRTVRIVDLLDRSCKTMKKSKYVPLHILGTLTLLAACDSGNNVRNVQQNTYANREDCSKDWGNPDQNCRPSGATGIYIGPRYIWNRGAGYPVAIDSNGQTRVLADAPLAHGAPSTAVRTVSMSVVRGGFGGTAEGFGRSGGS
jgi:homospermidine synthase